MKIRLPKRWTSTSAESSCSSARLTLRGTRCSQRAQAGSLTSSASLRRRPPRTMKQMRPKMQRRQDRNDDVCDEVFDTVSWQHWGPPFSWRVSFTRTLCTNCFRKRRSPRRVRRRRQRRRARRRRLARLRHHLRPPARHRQPLNRAHRRRRTHRRRSRATFRRHWTTPCRWLPAGRGRMQTGVLCGTSTLLEASPTKHQSCARSEARFSQARACI